MKKILSLIMPICLVFLLIGCGVKPSADENTTNADSENVSAVNTLQEIQDKGHITIAMSPDYPPYEFKVMENGKEKVVGFDVEIANEIAKDLGVELRILDLSFDGLLVALNASKADMVISGMTPSPERAAAVDFSDIYYTAEQGVIVRIENKDTLQSIESLNGKKVGVQKGSIQEKMAQEQIPNANLVSLSKLPNIIMDLKSGNIDAAVVEIPVAEGYVHQFSKDLAMSGIKIVDETGGSAIAMRKNSPELLEQVNNTIKRLQSENLIEKFVVDANNLIISE